MKESANDLTQEEEEEKEHIQKDRQTDGQRGQIKNTSMSQEQIMKTARHNREIRTKESFWINGEKSNRKRDQERELINTHRRKK